MKRPAVPVWLWPCIALTAILSAYSISLRHQVEARNKAVTLAVEIETVEAFAAGQGISIGEALAKLKAQGLGAVVLGEETIGDLVGEGYAEISANEVTLRTDRVVSSLRAIEALSMRAERGLRTRFPNAKIIHGQEGGEEAIRVEFASPSLIRQTAIGLNPGLAQLVEQSGLVTICRMSNPVGVSGEYVRKTLAWARENGARIFLPQGDQVLGRRDALTELMSALRSEGMLYASPEFTKIGGDATILGAAPELVVRLHSAQVVELDKLPLSEAIDRYAKAARERNMRVLLVRPSSFSAADPLHNFGEFLKSINDEVRKDGGDMGPAKPFEDSQVPPVLTMLIAISTIPTAYFVAFSLLGTQRRALVVAVIYGLICVATVTSMGRSLTALSSAVVFPLAALLVLDASKGKNNLLEFMIVSAISLVGGMAVAGLLNGLPFFVKAQEFRGIKVAVFVPILILGWYWAARFTNLKEAMRNPVTWGAAFLSIALLVSLVFMNARTGNESPAAVSDWELRFRSLLDALLYVRPRTKSFMIGHPLLIVGIGLLIWQRKHDLPKLAPWTALALTGGAVGQTDIVNTLCHLHTPVALSLIRIFVALIPGCLLGFLAWVLIRRILPTGELKTDG